MNNKNENQENANRILTYLSVLPLVASIVVFVLTLTKSIAVFASGTQ